MVSYFITVILYWIIRIILLFFYYYSYKIMESKKMWRKKLIMTVEMCQSLYTTTCNSIYPFFLCDEHNYIIFVGSPIFSLTFSKINRNWIADVDYVLTLKEFYILNHKLNVYFRFLFKKFAKKVENTYHWHNVSK